MSPTKERNRLPAGGITPNLRSLAMNVLQWIVTLVLAGMATGCLGGGAHPSPQAVAKAELMYYRLGFGRGGWVCKPSVEGGVSVMHIRPLNGHDFEFVVRIFPGKNVHIETSLKGSPPPSSGLRTPIDPARFDALRVAMHDQDFLSLIGESHHTTLSSVRQGIWVTVDFSPFKGYSSKRSVLINPTGEIVSVSLGR